MVEATKLRRYFSMPNAQSMAQLSAARDDSVSERRPRMSYPIARPSASRGAAPVAVVTPNKRPPRPDHELSDSDTDPGPGQEDFQQSSGDYIPSSQPVPEGWAQQRPDDASQHSAEEVDGVQADAEDSDSSGDIIPSSQPPPRATGEPFRPSAPKEYFPVSQYRAELRAQGAEAARLQERPRGIFESR